MYKDIIKDICEELDIKMDILSKGWLISLEKDNKKRYILGFKYDLNSQSDSLIADDKFALYEVLSKYNVPVISHKLMLVYDYNKDKEGFTKEVIDYFNSNNKDIVIKSNSSTCGKGVYHITDENDLIPTMEKIYLSDISVSLCPYYDIKKEYRLIYLNGEVKLIYGKEKPVVVGNGKNTLLELLQEFNPSYFSKHKLKKDFDYNYIPKMNEVIEYNWQFNLDKGARLNLNVDNNLKPLLEDIAFKCMDKINLKFCSIDIIETTNNELLVMEINSGIMMSNLMKQLDNGYEVAKSIYKEAIELMFK